MTNQRIVYQNANGEVCVVIPTPEYMQPVEVVGEDGQVTLQAPTLEALAAKVVPQGVAYEVLEVAKLPQSRNWRNAWEKQAGAELVTVNLEKAKVEHKKLMVQKALERAPVDEFGQQDLAHIKAEIEALDLESVNDFQTLFNIWPPSIEKRQVPRVFKMHKGENE